MKDLPNKMNGRKEKTTRAKKYAQAIVDTIREPLLILDKNLQVVSANVNFYSSFEVNREETEGRMIYELGNNQWDIPRLRILLEAVLPGKENFKDFEVSHHFENIGLRIFLINASQLEVEAGEEELILLSFQDVTERMQIRKKEKRYLKSFRTIFAEAPAMICTLRGPQHIFELANEKYFQLVGNRDIIGKPVREAIPEAESQGFFELLDGVYNTGKPFIGNELPIKLMVGEEKFKSSFLNFVYQPTFDNKGNVDGIFVHVVDVTEQVLARKEIEASENQLRRLIDTLPAIIWISNKEGHNIYLNKNWYGYTGQNQEEAENHGWLNAIHPEDKKNAKNIFRKAHAEEKPFVATYRLRSKNSGYRWVIDSGSPKFNRDGEYEGLIGTLVDVHEEKRKEQQIKEKEHRIRSIVEEATIPTAVYTGSEMRIELANDAMIQLWGKDKSVLGKMLHQAVPELEGQPFHQLLQEVYATGKTYWGKEDRVDLMVNGKLQTGYFNFTYKPLRNEKGEIYGILNMALDVTEMVKSKELLKESEHYFRQMTDLMPGKILNTDAMGNAIYFNRQWLEDSGLNFKKLQGRGWQKMIHPNDFRKFMVCWKKSLKTGNEFEMEFRFLNKNGAYKWHLGKAVAVKDEAGKIKLWISSAVEIQKLKEEEKRKEDFLKMVSHELKTPVTSIKGYVQLLLSLLDTKKDSRVSSIPIKPSLERIDNQIGRLTRLIAEMLDISRIEENKLELKKETFSINELVNETVQDINYTNTRHKIEIFHDFQCKVHADKDRIGQVLINFVTNAIKYSPDNQHVEVKIQKIENNKVSISIKDKGIGIDKKNHKNIFKRFYRVGGKNEETYSGFGIGLYLANEIIERHQGYITVNSKRGIGSEFIFVLGIASAN